MTGILCTFDDGSSAGELYGTLCRTYDSPISLVCRDVTTKLPLKIWQRQKYVAKCLVTRSVDQLSRFQQVQVIYLPSSECGLLPVVRYSTVPFVVFCDACLCGRRASAAQRRDDIRNFGSSLGLHVCHVLGGLRESAH